MAETKTLEEAYEELFATAARIPLASPAEFQSAARALALAAFKMGVNVRTPLGHTWNYEDDEQRRIEELGA